MTLRLQHIKQLTKVNLIYANPQMIEKKRNKEAKSGKTSSIPPYMSVLLQNGILLLVFLLLYGFMFAAINFTQYPGMFTTFIMMFIVMALLQGFYLVYNLFYESKDLAHYLPLPFKGSEVFTAKLVVLALMILPYLIPILALFIMLGQDAGQLMLVSIVTSLLLFLLLMIVVFFFSVVLVHLITKLSFFRKNKQAVTTILYALSSLGMVAVIFFISSMGPGAEIANGQVMPDYRVIPFIHIFHKILLNPISATAWLGILLWIALLAVLALLVFKWVVPGFYREEEGIVSSKPNKSKNQQKTVFSLNKISTSNKTNANSAASAGHPTSVNRTLWKYNFGLMQDGTLIMQHLSSSIIFPILLLGPAITNGVYLEDLTFHYWALSFFAGFVYAFLTLNAISIVGVIISLDRENFIYMKSLPFSMKNYLKQKFLFAFVAEAILPLILGIVFIFITKVPFLLGVLFLIGIIIGLFVLCHYYFARDFRLLNLEWQNLTELFSRGGGNFSQVISIFGCFIIGILAIVLIGVLLNVLPPAWQTIVSVLTAAVPIVLCIVATKWYKERFWSRFTD